ncbi:hypothetical protein E3O55_18955 [Cryobacterium sp. MDB1-18-2]|uniref:hypothetical protein n=1 Tax=unclassified Cryobacterium TaxID=2649013 RepID=UPI00106C15F7|nr:MULTISPECIES: hypothetical protein [unclassified Cryobacterium]TFC22098.1 hypothetical protein E3O55_18955 [Cryobacterium sp. MDB1-18-2]TFC40671.1 hypothetical protein E3O50_12750 [Cryobacterium sp. MDB1-18-1]
MNSLLKKSGATLGLVGLLSGAGLLMATSAEATVITCAAKANNPHASSHVSGTINAQGTVTCDGAAAEMYISVILEKSDGRNWQGSAYSMLNTKSGSANAATSCSNGPGSFRNVTYISVQAPVGSTGNHSETLQSSWVDVACGLSAFTLQPTSAFKAVDLSLAESKFSFDQ